MIEKLIKYRRDLHQIPEINKDLPKTFAYVNNELKKLNCELLYPDTNAVCAFFDFGAKEAIAYRSDMDALPIFEKNTHDYKSTHEGKMHACGHDGHMSMLLTFAQYLNTVEENPKYNVMLIFQPAEESTGGAQDICDSGLFEKYAIKKAYGCHLWPDLPIGTVASRPGALMAKCTDITVEIKGFSTHVAKASQGKDAMVAGAKFLLSTYEMEANEIDSDIFRLIKFGKMVSGTVGNAISAYTSFTGSLRTFDEKTCNYMKSRIFEIAKNIEKETGCQVAITMIDGYPPVINDNTLFETIVSTFPDEITILDEPSLIVEDFSIYGTKAPSVFFFLGIDVSMPLHADTFDFDEKALVYGVEFFTKLLEV